MRRLSILVIGLVLSGWAVDATALGPDPVKDCPVGLVCFTIAEAAEIDRFIVDLERKTSIAKARKPKRTNVHLGCTGGPGIASDGSSPLVLACGIGFGFRLGD